MLSAIALEGDVSMALHAAVLLALVVVIRMLRLSSREDVRRELLQSAPEGRSGAGGFASPSPAPYPRDAIKGDAMSKRERCETCHRLIGPGDIVQLTLTGVQCIECVTAEKQERDRG